MKKLLLLALATCFTFAVASAQNPGYFLHFGTADGSDLAVTLDSDIEVPLYYTGPAIGSGDEDQDNNGVVDSVNFFHIPLDSDDIYITSRDGGIPIHLCHPVGQTNPFWHSPSSLATIRCSFFSRTEPKSFFPLS
jgi:hypothetical protein